MAGGEVRNQEEGVMEQELRERMLAWGKAHPKATLYEIEAELDAQMAVMRAGILGETAGAKRAEVEQEQVSCPVCQGQMVRDGVRKRRLKTTGDQAVELERVYMRCPECGYGFFSPWIRR